MQINNRPYVLVDSYGDPRALPRLLQMRTDDVRKFLERHYPTYELPSVAQAQAMVEELAKARENIASAERERAALDELKRSQKHNVRRTDLEGRIAALKQRHHAEQAALAERQRVKRENRKAAFRAREKFIRLEREASAPRGLAAFLGKVSGINLVRTKFHKYQDRKRLREFLRERRKLKGEQAAQREELKQRQLLEKRPLERELRGMVRTENDERRKLRRELEKERLTLERGGSTRMPPVKRPRVKDLGEKDALVIEANTASGIRTRLREQGALAREFTRAADELDDKSGGGGAAGPAPENTRDPSDRPRGRKRKRDRGKDYDRGR